MNEQVEKLVRIAVEAAASVDVTYEADGSTRVNIYPREPKAEAITVTLDCDTSSLNAALDDLRKRMG